MREGALLVKDCPLALVHLSGQRGETAKSLTLNVAFVKSRQRGGLATFKFAPGIVGRGEQQPSLSYTSGCLASNEGGNGFSIGGDHQVLIEFADHLGAPRLTHPLPLQWIEGQKAAHRLGKAASVAHFAQEARGVTINHCAAARNIGGDNRPRHSGGLDQRARRALAIGGQDHTGCCGDRRAYVWGSAKIFDCPFPGPVVDHRLIDGGAILCAEGSQQLEACLGMLRLDDPRRLDKFDNAFVAQQASDHQEDRWRGGIGHGGRREVVKINARARQKARLLGADNAALEEDVAVVFVLEKDAGKLAEGAAVELYRDLFEKLSRQKGRAKAGYIGHKGDACRPRGARAENIVFDGEAQGDVGASRAECGLELALQARSLEGIEALGAHRQGVNIAADCGELPAGLVLRGEHAHAVVVGEQRLDERFSEIPDIPGRINRHQDMHARAFRISSSLRRGIFIGARQKEKAKRRDSAARRVILRQGWRKPLCCALTSTASLAVRPSRPAT